MGTEAKLQKTIFIMGISSFVGSSLAEFLKQDYHIIGSYNHHPVELEGILTFPMDISKRDATQLIISLFRPDIIIYCIGFPSIESCDNNIMLANTLNAAGVFNLVAYSERYKSQLIYISSAYVFSGERNTYTEDENPGSNSIYGKSKSAAEIFIQDSCLSYLVLRCCSLYGGGSLLRRPSWFERIQRIFFEGSRMVAQGNVKIGFLDIVYLAGVIKACIECEIDKEILHVASTDIMSQYEFILEYANVFGEDKSSISREIWDFPQIRSDLGAELEYKIDIKKIEERLNIKMPSIQESLRLTRHRLGGGGNKRQRPKESGITFI